jgi:hypothetical protein
MSTEQNKQLSRRWFEEAWNESGGVVRMSRD